MGNCRFVVRRKDSFHHLTGTNFDFAVKVMGGKVGWELQVVHKLRTGKQTAFTLEIEPAQKIVLHVIPYIAIKCSF